MFRSRIRAPHQELIVAVLHRTATGRYHPACFSEETSGQRRSIGHHTEGFSTRQEALAAARTVAKVIGGCIAGCEIDDRTLEWHGELPILLPGSWRLLVSITVKEL